MAADRNVRIEISAIDRASAVFDQVGKSATGLIETLGPVGMAIGGVLSLQGSLESAAAYETALNEMARVTDASFSSIKNAVGSLGGELGSQTQLMQGYYAIMSAGVTDATEALDLLQVASKGSKVASVTQAQTINALTAVMAGYSGEIANATEASDLLFTIEKQGKTTFAELVPLVGDLAAISKQAGMSSNEMGAALAAVTLTAGGTASAATQYKAIITALLNPQEQLRKIITDLGYASGDALIKQQGFSQALMSLRDAAQKAGIEIGALFGSSEAMTALGPLFADNFARVTTNMEAMQGKAGATAGGTVATSFIAMTAAKKIANSEMLKGASAT